MRRREGDAITPVQISRLVLLAVCVGVLLVITLTVSVAQAAPRTAHVSALSSQITQLDARLDAVTLRYAETAQRIDQLRGRVRATRRELRAARYELAMARTGLRSRVVALYKERPVDLLDVVMGSASFEEFLGRLTRMRQLSEADARLVDTIERTELRLRHERGALTGGLARLQTTLQRSAADRARLQGALAERRSLLAELRKAAPVKAKRLARPPADKPSPPITLVAEGGWWPTIQAAAAQNGIAARGLYRLMLAESGGVATARNGPYLGLFQYTAATWHGGWNLWRGSDIFDGAAQIKATARAVKLGMGPSLWPNTYGYAFSS